MAPDPLRPGSLLHMAESSHPPSETMFAAERSGAAVPEVSVVIPLFNYGQFIAEALASVGAQTLGDLDLIVVDDGSTDGGVITARDWLVANAGRFRRAYLLRHRQNAGLAATRNHAIAHAATPFVLPLDADNALYPTCLEKLLRSLRPTTAAFAYCLVEQFGPGLKPEEPRLMHLSPWDPRRLALGNYIDAMTLLRKAEWEQVGGYSRTMPRPGWEDYDLWLKFARAGQRGLQVLQILARYRVHAASMLRTVTNRKDSQRELRAYFHRNYPEHFPAPA
jgi:glycosyltransferase involved in cell wall biosynthesis